jgi:hypothetical protein
MDKKALLRVVVIACALASFGVVAAWAGGPVCPPVKCAPPMCPPPMCGPPPVCGPAPMCGPPPCAPVCKENPLAKIFKGAWSIVTGTVALPFALLDCLVEKCRPACGPPPMCGPRMACAPPMCPPPMCPPPMCGPPGCPPGMMGYGMAPGRPMGFGYGAPRKNVPFANKKASPVKYFAGQDEALFGAYW